MKKNGRLFKGILALVLYALYAVILLLEADLTGIALWVGFGFTTLISVVTALALFMMGGSPLDAKEDLYETPLNIVCGAGMVIFMAVGIVAAFLQDSAVKGLAITELVLTVAFGIALGYTVMMQQKLRDMEQHQDEKVFTLREMAVRAEIAARMASDPDFTEQVLRFAEDLRLAPPMSRGQAEMMDSDISRGIDILGSFIRENRLQEAAVQLTQLKNLLTARNTVNIMERGRR